MSKVNYVYVRENDVDVTVAYRYNESDTGVVASFARCSKRDQFTKRIGRDVARGRLEANGGVLIPFRVINDTLGTDETGYGAVAAYLRKAVAQRTIAIP